MLRLPLTSPHHPAGLDSALRRAQRDGDPRAAHLARRAGLVLAPALDPAAAFARAAGSGAGFGPGHGDGYGGGGGGSGYGDCHGYGDGHGHGYGDGSGASTP